MGATKRRTSWLGISYSRTFRSEHITDSDWWVIIFSFIYWVLEDVAVAKAD